MELCLIGLSDGKGGFVCDIARLAELAQRITAAYPDVVVEEVHEMGLVAQVPDGLQNMIEQALGCRMTGFIRPGPQPPKPPQPDGIPNWDVYANPPFRMSDKEFDEMIENFNEGEGDD